MTRAERFWVWTGRFSDEQCAVAILTGYLTGWALFGGLAYWWLA